MREHLVLELRSTNQDESIRKLLSLIEQTGGLVSTEVIEKTEYTRLIINYETDRISEKRTRGAGRKKKGHNDDTPVYRIGEVKQLVAGKGLPQALKELQISRATYYRRMKSLRERGYEESDVSWNQRFFI